MKNNGQKVLVSGSQGFVNGYVIPTLLDKGYKVIGIDNYAKYGKINRSFDTNKNFTFVEGDAKNTDLLKELLSDCDHFIASAAKIGGISFFNAYAADLMIENERLLASQFDAAIWAHKHKKLKKITAISSSMIYESATEFPSKEGHEEECPPPFTCYGFQKLAVHYFCKGAFSQYGLPYSIAIPFNCVGTGEYKALSDVEILSGNIKLALSHVIPDLIQKIYKGQYPLHVLGCGGQERHYTYAQDLADGIIAVMENMDGALNESFNLSTPHGHKVLEIAKLIWDKIGDKNKEFKYVCDAGYEGDVMKRVPDITKAKEILGFEAKTQINEILDTIIPFYTSKEFLQ